MKMKRYNICFLSAGSPDCYWLLCMRPGDYPKPRSMPNMFGRWLDGKTAKLLHGDLNTKYFQLIANGKHRKTRIFQQEDGDKIIQGDDALKRHITDYYRGLFGPPDPCNLSMDESRREDIRQILDDEKEKLIAPFTYDEVRSAIFQMEHNKAPGPDGFPAEFYVKVKWSFLQQTLRTKGFPQKWCSWIESLVTKGSVGVKVNDNIGKFFQTK